MIAGLFWLFNFAILFYVCFYFLFVLIWWFVIALLVFLWVVFIRWGDLGMLILCLMFDI